MDSMMQDAFEPVIRDVGLDGPRSPFACRAFFAGPTATYGCNCLIDLDDPFFQQHTRSTFAIFCGSVQ
jgi:hypothetical protein